MAGAPNITGWDLLFITAVIGFIGWGSIELIIFIFKWIFSHLNWNW